jgi:hypothetical protein
MADHRRCLASLFASLKTIDAAESAFLNRKCSRLNELRASRREQLIAPCHKQQTTINSCGFVFFYYSARTLLIFSRSAASRIFLKTIQLCLLVFFAVDTRSCRGREREFIANCQPQYCNASSQPPALRGSSCARLTRYRWQSVSIVFFWHVCLPATFPSLKR